MSKPNTLDLSPEELFILASWATPRVEDPVTLYPDAERELAVQMLEASARYMTQVVCGPYVIKDEHALTPTHIDVSSWGLPVKWCPHCLTCYETGAPHVGCRP